MDNDASGSAIGLVPQDAAALAIRQIVSDSELALPDQAAVANNVLAITFPGGFRHVFTNGSSAISQDWSAYSALGFWLHGTASGDTITVEVFNITEPVASVTAEVADDFSGWQHLIIPFDLFTSDTEAWDWSAVASYGLSLPAEAQLYLDDVRLFTVENTSEVRISDSAPQAAFVLDDTVTWESREWELVWVDEFDEPASSPINSESWTCEVGGHGWGNNELEYYTTNLENVSQNGDGSLVITAQTGQPEDDTCWYGQCAFTSARCTTQDKVEFTYGRVEARLKIPRGQGIWPAFWMLGANFQEVGWPNSGEIDIMENIGSEPQTVHGTVHGPGYSGASGIGNAFSMDEDFADDFHIYAIDWDPNVIRWYVDGELYGTVSLNNMTNREWVFDHDFFIIMNVAVGGAWPGFPDESTEFPQEMQVDYVRVYQLKQ